MTSNLGSETIQASFEENAAFIIAEEVAKKRVMQELKIRVRPEFLNRIDDILLFSPLTQKEIQKIVGLQIQQLSQRFKAQGLHLEARPEAVKLLAEWSFDPLFGGRPVKRTLQEKVLNPLSKALLKEDKNSTPFIKITVDKQDQLCFEFEKSTG